jgi:hypothetical protein
MMTWPPSPGIADCVMIAPMIDESWQPAARYPDPAIEILDPRFERLRLKSASVERLATGTRWGEGPVWFGDLRTLVWSDIPNDRMLRWDEETGAVGVCTFVFAQGSPKRGSGTRCE